MKILQSILSESKGYYLDVKKKIKKKIASLPRGGIKERKISGKKYYYLQYRKNKKILQKYIGKYKPEDIINQIKKRKILNKELKKVNEALKIIRRSEGKRHG